MKEIVDTWFSRAGALPLSFTWSGLVEKEEAEINSILRPLASQLIDLRIRFSSASRVSDLIDNVSFPLLQTLDLTGGSGIAPSPAALPIFTFRESPRLRYLVLHGISPASLIGVRWERLERLSVTNVQECLDVLSRCTSLLMYEPYGSSQNSYHADQQTISHPQVTNLVLASNNHEMLRYLALPALRDLTLCVQRLGDEDMLSFLSRSRGELRSFTVYYVGQGPLVLALPWFQYMMYLTILSLSELAAQSRTNFVRALNRQHDPGFLPALETLMLTDWKSDQLDTQAVDALHSRTASQEAERGKTALTQLKSFVFLWMPEGPYTADSAGMKSLIRDHRVVLRDLEMRGMEVYVGTESKNHFG
ncbi:hypothetical protein C8F04DRAFT_1069952 [Mycena alexandri]|uniref:Uncharacterized protein n=1 Tax=Mycena alexandri TaxID=1745969 RepID=A0AAD6XE21_9AGAR|nr:hypothetical protein C8F04DRAFT_1069952 [Mycena alexandri]